MYNIYPTLLDAYNRYKADLMSFDDIINRINREPFEKTYPILKGEAFHTAVEHMSVKQLDKLPDDGKGNVYLKNFDNDEQYRIPKWLVDFFIRSLKQNSYQAEYFIESYFNFDNHDVRVYGFVDFLIKDRAVDNKTTGKYSYAKFQDSMQHRCYLNCLRDNGLNIDKFSYLVTDFKDWYIEDYHYNERMYYEMRDNIIDFIDFININRPYIDYEKTKIFKERSNKGSMEDLPL